MRRVSTQPPAVLKFRDGVAFTRTRWFGQFDPEAGEQENFVLILRSLVRGPGTVGV